VDARTTKPVIAGCADLALLMVILVGAAIYMVRRIASAQPAMERPAQLETAGVQAGADLLTKRVLLEGADSGPVTDIAVQEDPADGGMMVVGSRGALFLDAWGAVVSSVVFDARVDHVDVVDVEGDGVCEFMNRGSWAIPASLIDHEGKELWR